MKTIVPSVALLCSALIFLNSCSVSKNSVLPPKNDTENIDGTSYSCYVIKTDGSKQYYSTLKLVTGVLVTPHLLGDNNIVIDAKDILAYQDNKRYAVSRKLLITQKTSLVAAETLPGFAVRVAKGKLNVYSRKFYNGNNSVTEYFLQNGDEGEIVAFTKSRMNEMLKDNPKAADFYNSKAKSSPRSKKLMAAVNIYNNAPQFISKN